MNAGVRSIHGENTGKIVRRDLAGTRRTGRHPQDLGDTGGPHEALARRGFNPGDAEYQEVIARLATRTKGLDKTGAGYVTDLEQAAKTGHQDLKFTFTDNAVDPSEFTDFVNRYDFRLQDDGGGNLVPQYFVNGKWRSVTGDVDFLQLTHGNGAPLSDADRVRIYAALSKSPVGFMHPETATWTDLVNNSFNFDTKLNDQGSRVCELVQRDGRRPAGRHRRRIRGRRIGRHLVEIEGEDSGLAVVIPIDVRAAGSGGAGATGGAA